MSGKPMAAGGQPIQSAREKRLLLQRLAIISETLQTREVVDGEIASEQVRLLRRRNALMEPKSMITSR